MTVIRSNLNGISIFLQKMKALDKPRRLMPSQLNLDLKKRPDITVNRFPTHTSNTSNTPKPPIPPTTPNPP